MDLENQVFFFFSNSNNVPWCFQKYRKNVHASKHAFNFKMKIEKSVRTFFLYLNFWPKNAFVIIICFSQMTKIFVINYPSLKTKISNAFLSSIFLLLRTNLYCSRTNLVRHANPSHFYRRTLDRKFTDKTPQRTL